MRTLGTDFGRQMTRGFADDFDSAFHRILPPPFALSAAPPLSNSRLGATVSL